MLSTNLDGQVSSSTVHCLWSYFWVRYPRSLSELGVDGTSNLFVINIGLLNLFKQKLFTDTIVFYKGGEVNFNVIISAMWKSNCLFIEKIKQNRIKHSNWQEQRVGYLQAWPGIWTWKYR